MQLLNATKMQAGYAMGMQPDGRELLVVVVKGTFTIPASPSAEPKLAEEQAPLVDADVFTGEPGFSAPLYECDFAPRKPFCDVLLNGSAYAPRGKPTERVTVSLRVGAVAKSFSVVGKRVWQAGMLSLAWTSPEPFTVMPISYDNAFGGVDRSKEDPARERWFPTNHAGVGYHYYLDAKGVDGTPLPNTEEPGAPVINPGGNYRPMAFGAVGRAWQPRPKLAGTYDQNWIDNVFPFLPADFDECYYQAAPPDQQMDHAQGGEEVELVNLTPQGRTAFRLPKVDVPIEFSLRDGSVKATSGLLDTVLLEPDQGRFLLCWRAHLPLRRTVFEVSQAIVGRMPPGWHKARERGKTYYPSLRELVSSRA
jgi:hypothetical protein